MPSSTRDFPAPKVQKVVVVAGVVTGSALPTRPLTKEGGRRVKEGGRRVRREVGEWKEGGRRVGGR